MKYLIKKIYIILFLVMLSEPTSFAKENKGSYTKANISNYFLGIISAKNDNNDQAHEYLKKVKSLSDDHKNYKVAFLRNLILLEKFNEAFSFSESVWNEEELFFEADLLIGLEYFKKKDYKNSEKYFKRLNNISRYNFYFDNLIGNIFITWNRAAQGKENESFTVLEKIPQQYEHLKKLQRGFLKCFFDRPDTLIYYEKIIQDKNYNFSRYNFFLVNYLLYEKRKNIAAEVIKISRKKHNSNILLKQTENYLINDKTVKIKKFFNCKNPEHNLAEFFYIIANLYATEKNYQMSNFYIKISKYLNKSFLTNEALLAENFYYQKQYKKSKDIYKKLKKVGSPYSWYASRSISTILLAEKGIKSAAENIEKEFNLLENPNFEHYYDMANFYKENNYHSDAIKYYSLALNELSYDHSLIPKILDKRGSSYERLGDWDKAEKDLLQSLEILPNQAHVLNYLAYSWIDRGLNLDKGLEMLIKANNMREGDGYIIDSLGWAYYAKKDYAKAEKYLQKAVELLPTDPVINDHYGDSLWMLKKNIQARHIWKNVLKFKKTEKKLKEQISKKLLFGLESKL